MSSIGKTANQALQDLDTLVAANTADIAALASIAGQNLLYHSLTHDDWIEGVTFNDIADDTYIGNVWTLLHSGNAPDVAGLAGSGQDFGRCFQCTWDSDAQIALVQFLEAKDVIRLRGKEISLSFDAWGTGVTSIRSAIAYWTSTADGITSDLVGSWSTNPTLATNWAFITTPAGSTTIDGNQTRYAPTAGVGQTVPTTANNLAVVIWTPTTEVNTDVLQIANVKLEGNSTDTPFVARSSGDERRAYSRLIHPITKAALGLVKEGGVQTSGSTVDYSFPIAMRTTPGLVHNATGLGGGATQARSFNYTLNADLTVSSFSLTIGPNANENDGHVRFGNGTNGSNGDIHQMSMGSSVYVAFVARL